MSESARDELTVSDREFSVRKSLNTDQFQTLAVVFDVRSSRNDSTRIQLSDTIPDRISMDDVGFHPEYGGDHWTIDGNRVVFERSFEPGEEYTTIYGIRDLDADEADGLMSDPAIDILEDPEDAVGEIEAIDEIVDEESTEAVREVISGERDALPGMEAPADDTAVPESEEAVTIGADDIEAPEEPMEADDDLGEEPAFDEAGEGEPAVADAPELVGDEPTDDPLETSADDDSLLADDDEPLLGEPGDEESDEVEEPLEADSPFGEDGESLLDDDEPLLGESDDTEAEEAEDEPLLDESEADDGEADEPAAEAASEPSLDEEEESPLSEPVEESPEPVAADAGGEAESDELTVPVTGGVARVLAKELRQGNVSEEDRKLLRDELAFAEGSTEARIGHLQERVSNLEAYSDALESFLDNNGPGQEVLDDLRDSMAALEDDVSRIESRLASNAESIEGVRDDLGDVEYEVGDIGDDLDELEDTVSRIDDAVEDLKDDVMEVDAVASRVDSCENDLTEINQHLEELDAFRTRLSSVFGGGDED